MSILTSDSEPEAVARQTANEELRPATSEFSSVAVIGLGYIGLPTAAILSGNGLNVTGVDISAKTVDAVNRDEVPFVEPDLGIRVAGAVAQGMLKAQGCGHQDS